MLFEVLSKETGCIILDTAIDAGELAVLLPDLVKDNGAVRSEEHTSELQSPG